MVSFRHFVASWMSPREPEAVEALGVRGLDFCLTLDLKGFCYDFVRFLEFLALLKTLQRDMVMF